MLCVAKYRNVKYNVSMTSMASQWLSIRRITMAYTMAINVKMK
jgi:hypothetical protein